MRGFPLVGIGHCVSAPWIHPDGLYMAAVIGSSNPRDQNRWTALLMDTANDTLVHVGLTHVNATGGTGQQHVLDRCRALLATDGLTRCRKSG